MSKSSSNGGVNKTDRNLELVIQVFREEETECTESLLVQVQAFRPEHNPVTFVGDFILRILLNQSSFFQSGSAHEP